MQMMRVIEGKEEIEGYEFLHFSVASENVDGVPSIYTVVICKDESGYLEEFPLNRVRFI